jgi:hypothetical protein
MTQNRGTTRLAVKRGTPTAPAGDGKRFPSTTLYSADLGSAGARVRSYAALRYSEVYPGIDWIWRFHDGALEFGFDLAAGADPTQIEIAVQGADNIRIDDRGDLVIDGGAPLRYERPIAWQNGPAGEIDIAVSFKIAGNTVTFQVGEHDPTLPLIIDPVLRYSRPIGGAGYDAAYGVAVDASGAVYVTGETNSVDFISSRAIRTQRDAFVAKLSSDGSQVLYTVILSSAGNDAGKGIAIDDSGNVWVVGVAGGPGFPTTSGALARNSAGSEDAFVAKIDKNGALSYATYLGGGGSDMATAIAIAGGAVYVAGQTSSVNFPVSAGAAQTTYGGGIDAFLVKLTSGGSVVAYATLFGGSGIETAAAVTSDTTGNACVAGRTDSWDLPVRNAIQPIYAGSGDGFLACINPSGATWTAVTYWGASGPDQANAMTRDAAGNLYVAGESYSTAGGAPSYNAFITKFNSIGTSVLYHTLLGGSGSDSALAVAVDAAGHAWVAGNTDSVNFPVTDETKYGGAIDAFTAEFSIDGKSLLAASYHGGYGSDRAFALALTGNGEPVVAGATESVNFPSTAGNSPGASNAFVTRWRTTNSPPASSSFSPSIGSGTSQRFTAVFTDPDGYQDISLIGIEFGRQLGFVGTCFLYYTNGGLLLMNDTGSAWLPSRVPGSAGTLENSQCSIDLSKSSVSGSGATLSIVLALSFKAALGNAFQIYETVSDLGGLQDGWRAVGNWGTNAAPLVTSISPNAGSGNSKTFIFSFSDPDGYQDISLVGMEFGRQLGFVGTCFLYYNGSFLLMNDTGTAWLAAQTPGVAGTLQNSQCSIDVGRSTISASGTTLLVSVAVTFKTPIGPTFQMYASVTDRGGLTDGWKTIGSWGAATAPKILSVSPATGSGASGVFTFSYSDTDGYQNLSVIGMEFGRSLGFIGTCFMNYTGAGLFLMNDSGTAWFPPKMPGSAAVVENSQCSIDLSRFSVSSSGSTMTITLAVTFKAAIGNSLQIYTSVTDQDGLQDGWKSMGTWVKP